MKKTVIAAALVSTVFSGAAMAWTAGGTGGNIEIGGNIQITPYNTPWEVMVGAPVTNLDANITKGVTAVAIPVTKAIPVMGIRTASKTPFIGDVGLSPQINFNGAVLMDNFINGTTSISLAVMDADNPATQIGSLTADFFAGAEISTFNPNPGTGVLREKHSVVASDVGTAFWGGLGKTYQGILGGLQGGPQIKGAVTAINPEYTANYNDQGVSFVNAKKQNFWGNHNNYSAYYGSGIPVGKINIILTAPAANDVIKWKASLPVTVSYQ